MLGCFAVRRVKACPNLYGYRLAKDYAIHEKDGVNVGVLQLSGNFYNIYAIGTGLGSSRNYDYPGR